MRLVTNSIAPNKVTETEFGWRIEDVPFVKPMDLAGGYVPEESIKETANAWNGTPPTLNHPRNERGEPVAATKKPKLQLGRIENARYDGEFVRGDIQVNESDLVRLGGEALDIRDALENGEPINVSSQYRGEELPPGTYDGEFRSNVEKIVKPDSVALLPNKPAQCSVEDGCGINPQMVANAGVSITATDDAVSPKNGQAEAAGDTQTMQANQLSEARTPEFDGTTTGEWSKPDFSEYVNAFGFDAEQVDDLSDEQAQQIAATTLLGDPEAESFDSLQFFPVVEPDSMNLSENALMAVLSGRGAQADIPSDALESSRSVARRLLEEEFDRDMSDNSAFMEFLQTAKRLAGFGAQGGNEGAESSVDTANDADTDTMDRETYIEEITANSPLTEESLAERCDDGLEAIHSDVMEANEEETEDDTEDTTNVTDNDDGVVELTESELRDMISEEVAQVTANQQTETEKEELASDIVANSAEYEDTDTVLEDFPTTAALEAQKERVTPDASAGFPARGATTANTSEVDDYPDMDFGGD